MHRVLTLQNSESSELDTLNSSDLNTLPSGDERARRLPADLKLRFSHMNMAPQMSDAPYQSPYLSKPPPKEPDHVAKDVGVPYQGVDLTADANQATGTISWQ